MVSASVLLGSDRHARGNDIPYSDLKCSRHPGGMIYLAAGDHVYRQPLENLAYVHSPSVESAIGLPIAPRPFEPKGCPDHPLRGVGFKFTSFSDLADPAIGTATGGSIQILELDPFASWDTHDRYSLSKSNSCDTAKREPPPLPGLVICGAASAASSDRGRPAAFAVIVDPGHYAGPLGQPLTVLCHSTLSTQADDYGCELSYRLQPDLGVWYQFRTSLLPLSGLIAFDRELRRRIAEAEVPNYWWPSLPGSRAAATK
jgi:hypothetical protein